MGTVAQGWLVYQLTGSALALGWVGTGGSMATLLFSLYGGVVCDRVNKRVLLLWARGAMGLNSVAIGLLISFGLIQIWHLVVSSIISGLLFCFIMPAEQSIVSDLVDRETLLNAFSLNAIGMGLMGIVSASVSGLLIASVGVQGVYFLMGLFYVLAVFTISHLPDTKRASAVCNSVWKDFVEGVDYIWHSPVVMVVLTLGLARVLFAMPYRTFMPKFAEDVMAYDARGLGLLMSAPGLGGLISSLVLASLGKFRHKGWLFILSGIAAGLFLMLFVSTGHVWVVLPALVLLGIANNVCMVSNSTLVQSYSDTQFRGRVVSVSLMIWGLTPLGSLPAGWAADRIGVPLVVAGEGLLLILLFVVVAIRKPILRKLS
jgi:MFS family permease